MTVQSKLTSDLHALGVRPGGILLVHSSLRSLGTDSRGQRLGAETVIKSLLEALGPEGTLLLPALSYESVGPDHPVFDVCNAPSCVGALSEYFRRRPGTMRSVHPTHSVCGVGPRVEEMLGSHMHDCTPCGPNSPFARLPEVGGQVLFLGCGMNPNTSMHAIEEQVVPPYLFGEPVDYRVILADGSEAAMHVRSHAFVGWEQRYDRLEAEMHQGMNKGKVLEADCHLLDAAEMWSAALLQYRRNPIYFVERVE